MVDLRSRSQKRATAPRNYFARREQFRLLGLVMALGIVAVAIGKASRPSTWAWWRGDPVAEGEPLAGDDSGIDTRLRPDSARGLPTGTFYSPPQEPTEPAPAGEYFPGVRSEYLAAVEDRTWFHAAEHPAWFNLLDVARGADADELRAAAVGEVGFAQLYRQPAEYRGRVVTMRGVAKRAFPLTPPSNDMGLDRYWRIWLRPQGGSNPVVVYCLELPPGFPTSRVEEGQVVNIHESVAVSGFFFKNWAYSAPGQIRVAPLILAARLDWKREPAGADPDLPRGLPLTLLLLGTALGGTAFALWVWWTSNRLSRPARQGQDLLRQAYGLDALEAPNPEEEILALLGDLEREPPATGDLDRVDRS